jgi:vancomycin resistance protein YoaR
LENKKLKSGHIYGVAVLLVLMGGLSCYIYTQIITSSRFAPGVEIGGISAQGSTRDEAVTALNQSVAGMFDNSVAFYKDDYKYETKLGDLCLPIDSRQVIDSIWQLEKARSWRSKLANLNGRQKIVYPVNLTYDPAQESQLIQEWNTQWGSPPIDARLDFDINSGMLVVIPGQAGTVVDAEATFVSLPTHVDNPRETKISIIMKSQQPEITESVLSKMGQLSSFTTNYDTTLVNRSHNLALAAAAIDKSMVAPHTAFSFNETVGKCSPEKGYLDAMVIVGGKFEPGLAGGICQVSSTLYNTALLAGMDIIERSNHSLAVMYVPLGRDATVSNGSQDFKFMNNTDDPIYIRTAAGGGRLTISIYGNIQYKKKIELYNIVDQTVDYTTVTEVDPTLKPGEEKVDHNGQLGYVARAFRTFYDDNGNIIKTELLSRDTYDPLNKLIYRGPQVSSGSIPDTTQSPAINNGVPRTNNTENTVNPILPYDPNKVRP